MKQGMAAIIYHLSLFFLPSSNTTHSLIPK